MSLFFTCDINDNNKNEDIKFKAHYTFLENFHERWNPFIFPVWNINSLYFDNYLKKKTTTINDILYFQYGNEKQIKMIYWSQIIYFH